MKSRNAFEIVLMFSLLTKVRTLVERL